MAVVTREQAKSRAVSVPVERAKQVALYALLSLLAVIFVFPFAWTFLTSVKPDAVTCLECGERMKMLKRHLGTEHGLTPAEYRARWSLPADYPMVAPDYAAKRKELAVRIGLGRRPGQSPKAEANATPKTAPKARPKADAAPAKRKKLGVAFG